MAARRRGTGEWECEERESGKSGEESEARGIREVSAVTTLTDVWPAATGNLSTRQGTGQHQHGPRAHSHPEPWQPQHLPGPAIAPTRAPPRPYALTTFVRK